ncbi:MAG: ATP-dependent Clp protease ATP-binding subunit [Polyangiaceae bacterium]|nr:ATP-dependent Clp protease ATP-binding subunit [Polyangiaceae bacterium]
MALARTETELRPLCKRAEQLAARRREPLSTAHLLMAISAPGSSAASVLEAHRITPQRLERLVHSTVGDESDAIVKVVDEALSIASRTPARAAGALHLLLALLSARRCVAYRVLEQGEVDVSRLRSAVMQIAIGAAPVGARATFASSQAPPTSPSSGSAPAAAPRRAAVARGTVVSLQPTVRPRRPVTPGSPSPPVASSAPPARPAASAPPSAPPPALAVSITPSAAIAVSFLPPSAGAARLVPPSAAASRAPQPTRFELDPKRFPLLSSFGRNLTLAAARGELGPVVGREAEVERCLDVLAKRHANSPVLVGPPGVGKSSVVRAVAVAAAASAPGSADGRIFVELTAAELLGGAGVRGAVAERFATLRQEVKAARGEVVLAFDDIHQLFGGEAEAELGTELRQALARGELPCLGTSTPEDFRRALEPDPSLARRLVPIFVDEPPLEQTIAIVRQGADALGDYHGVRYGDDAVAAAVAWTSRYVPGRALPDKALSVLDLGGARARRQGLDPVPLAALAQVVSEQSDVPAERLLEADGERMLGLEAVLAETVVGHGAALARVAAVLRRNAAGLRGRRPIGTFLLLGPTGVGKTETAKAIAQALFHSPDALTRLDLSEYAEAHALARLVGAPPGYVGHESGGQLTEAVRRRPYSVVLLDEIEKAHRDVLMAFLQVFDEGRMTDGRGRTVDFTNTVIVLTSNLGAAAASAAASGSRIGFGSGASSAARSGPDPAVIAAAARAALPPEFFNRIDEVLAYAPLTRDEVRRVAERLLAGLKASLGRERGVELSFDEGVVEVLLGHGYDPELGARPMKRAVALHVEAPLAELILRGEAPAGGHIHVAPDEAGRLVPRALPPQP